MDTEVKKEKLKSRLINKLKLLNETAWEGKAKDFVIRKWLNNFEGEEEQIHMLFLLSQFMYFSDYQLRGLLKALFRDLYKYPVVREFRKANCDFYDIRAINNFFNEHLRRTRFIGIGDPSESGQYLLYPFRQENNISKDLFINTTDIIKEVEIRNEEGKTLDKKWELVDPNVRHYVFIDDFCGSGSQASKYSKTLLEVIKKIDDKCTASYLMLFGTTNGKNRIKRQTLFDQVESVFELDDSFRCFGPDSRYFAHKPDVLSKEYAKLVSEKYGYELMKHICELNNVSPEYLEDCAEDNSNGFKNGQMLLGFVHNTPDNTLPVFWYDEDKIEWYPFFKRYNKKY